MNMPIRRRSQRTIQAMAANRPAISAKRSGKGMAVLATIPPISAAKAAWRIGGTSDAAARRRRDCSMKASASAAFALLWSMAFPFQVGRE
ncbi:hypothetical protein MOP88_03290 [Sphingomonas sp. WKB10]|nr:hypothetical protein [Sphingomonas sp. WKB10]